MHPKIKMVMINLNGRGNCSVMETTRGSLTFQTIGSAFVQGGVHDFRFLPSQNTTIYPFTAENVKAQTAFMNELTDVWEPGVHYVFGLSVMTDNYFKVKPMAAVIKELFPDALIVGGGPHFKRENLDYGVWDSVEVALRLDGLDAVVVGDIQPMTELLTTYDGQLENVDLLRTRGLYFLNQNGNVAGSGLGRYPDFKSVPYVFTPSGRVSIMTERGCRQACGFCSLNPGRLGFSEELIVAALKEIYRLYADKATDLHFINSNPFEPHKVERFLRILDRADEGEEVVMPKSSYLDPSLLLQPKAFEYLMRLVMHGFISFFIGRDATDWETAREIGSNLGGRRRPKSQEQLDQEGEKIRRLIQELKVCETPWEGDFRHYRIDLMYIVSPFMTKERVCGMLDDMQRMEELTDERVFVKAAFRPLWPYPGTDVRSRYLRHAADPEFREQEHYHPRPWLSQAVRAEFAQRFIDATNIEEFDNLWKRRHELGASIYNMIRDAIPEFLGF
ncbi:MAG: hypothetical protein ABIE84_01720 [bacterium]